MACFITLQTDAFADTFNKQLQSSAATLSAGVARARRPLRGLEIKSDRYAAIKVVQSNGTEIPLWDAGSSAQPNPGKNTQYTNFILQSVREARMEKHQIVETFGESYIFFFGESPRFLDVSAVLVNSFDFNWEAEWWQNYDQYLRGSKSVQMGARTYLFYDDNVVEGYMLLANSEKSSDQPLMVQLTFRLFVTSYQNVSLVGDANYPTRANVNIPPDVSTTTADAFSLGQGQSSASNNASQSAAIQQFAQISAQQQLAGFGGGLSLTLALSQGAQLSSDLAIQQAEINAGFVVGPPFVLTQSQAFAAIEAGVEAAAQPTVPLPAIPRSLPIRSLISDNTDEYTAQLPPGPGQDGGADQEAPDLWQSSAQQVGMYGGDINSPDMLNSLGLGPNFGLGAGVGIGIGIGAGASVGASFGVTGGVGQNNVYGGINGGLGFTGSIGVGASASLTVNPYPVLTPASTSAAIAAQVAEYGNGVQLSGGVYTGTGVGGGIPGGLSGGTGAFLSFTGGTAFQAQQATSMGYGANLSGSGASINVGGAPSAFAMAVSTGDLVTTPSTEISFNIGPDGASSDTNETDLTI